VPNGDDKNWVRVCAAIDGFRVRYGRWPKRVRIMPACYVDLISHVLTPQGYALVSSYVELVAEDDAEMIADDESGNEYSYGKQSFPKREAEPPTRDWFGPAVLRPGIC
jgi:hypothetical protein